MKIAVLGTGTVGNTIGNRLIGLGHEVRMGSRSATNEKALAWVQSNGKNASAGTFEDAASFAELIFNCSKGTESVNILKSAGDKNLENKIIVDLANPLDFSKGMPPTLSVCNTSSLGEEIQAAFPKARVVKALNTMWNGLMVNPGLIGNGDHQVFICGNDTSAKAQVKELLNSFGWKEQCIMDLGDITGSRGIEMLLPLWLRIYTTTNNGVFNFKIVS